MHNLQLTREHLDNNTTILKKCNDYNRLQIMEAILIKEKDPDLNRQQTGQARTLKLLGDNSHRFIEYNNTAAPSRDTNDNKSTDSNSVEQVSLNCEHDNGNSNCDLSNIAISQSQSQTPKPTRRKHCAAIGQEQTYYHPSIIVHSSNSNTVGQSSNRDCPSPANERRSNMILRSHRTQI